MGPGTGGRIQRLEHTSAQIIGMQFLSVSATRSMPLVLSVLTMFSRDEARGRDWRRSWLGSRSRQRCMSFVHLTRLRSEANTWQTINGLGQWNGGESYFNVSRSLFQDKIGRLR